MFCHLKNVVFLLSLGASLQSFSCSALPQQRNSSGYAALETRDAKDPTPRIITYHQTIYSKGDSQYVPILPLVGTGVTHINIGAIHLNENEGDIRLNDHAPWHERFVPLRRDIGEVQKSGIKVFAFLGGAAHGTYWRLSRPGQFEKYYEPLRDMLATWNFDGLDLDIEEPVSLQSVIRLIDRVKQDFGPDFLITAAPVAPALLTRGYNLAGFNFFDLERERGDDIAWYNAQFYCGHAQASDTTDYERIISHGWDPAKVVMGVCANPQLAQGYVPMDRLQAVVKRLKSRYSRFGGVFSWEYFSSLPGGEEHPEQWSECMRDCLTARKRSWSCYPMRLFQPGCLGKGGQDA